MEPEIIEEINNGEISPDKALKVFKQNSFISTSPYFLTHWKTQKSFFYFKGSLLAFEKTKHHFVIIGEPAISANRDENLVYKSFLEYAHSNKKKVCGYYVGKTWKIDSFKKLSLGTSVRINLNTYDLNTSRAKEVRRSLRKGKSSEFKTLDSTEIDFDKLQILIEKWGSKKLPIKLNFLLSKPRVKTSVSTFEKWFTVEKDGEYIAFCSLLPFQQENCNGYYIDHMVYDPFR